MDIKTTLKASVAAAALVALAAPIGTAEAAGLSAANSKVDVTVGGRVHRGLVYIDDGQHEELFHTPGVSGNSEMWLAGKGALTESVTMGGYLRWDITKEDGTWSFGSTTGDDTVAVSEDTGTNKYEYIYWTHKDMGTLSMGAMEPAADGTFDNRAGGNAANAENGVLSNTAFTSGAAGTFQGTAGTYYVRIDPGDTSPKIRFDSNSFSGFSLHADYRQDGGGSIGGKFSTTLGGIGVDLRAGYDNNASGQELRGGSIKLSHDSGFSVAGNYGKQDNQGATTDPDWWRVTAAYSASMSSLGATEFHIGYAETEDANTIGNKGEVFRIGVKQSFDAVGAHMNLEYYNFSAANAAGTDFNDIDAVLFETAFNF